MGAKLNKLGIETIEDLLFYWPRAYQDYTQITKIADLARNKLQETPRLCSGQASNKQFKNPNYQNTNKANQANEANFYTIRARIVGIANKRTSKRRFTITEAVVEDGTGSLKVIWFNQPYLVKMLKPGSEVILNGKVAYNYFSRDLVMESPNRTNKPKIVPVYAETEGISSFFISKLISSLISHFSFLEEHLPEQIIKQNNLLGLQDAILNIHQPQNSEMLERARERIAFDELFIMALRAQLSKIEVEQKIAPRIEIEERLLKEFTKELPFELTEDQKKAAWVIIKEMKGDIEYCSRPKAENYGDKNFSPQSGSKNIDVTKPMNRLLNGDVGSGKTVVAAFAAYVAIKAGYRVALMAPTEILAQQHFETCCDILSKHGISVSLITSSQTKINGTQRPQNNFTESTQKKIREANKVPMPESGSRHGVVGTNLANEASQADLVIGTHALLQDKVDLKNIGLVIVDEQHRFGVKQRAALLKNPNLKIQNPNKFQNPKSKKATSYKLPPTSLEKVPHFLSMTATPIPRTLYLALFADLDLSVIKTMPIGRKEIKTRVVDEANRDKAYQFIRKQIEAGRQAFVICPLIEIKNKISNIKNNENDLSEHKMTAQELFDQERKSVTAEFDKLSKQIFPDLKIGMLHGRMKSKEKEAAMGEYSAGKVDILVSTSVVEVGVDIPNASIMMIEDAERFGLAQLHQFRGRVGRAEHQSYCFLFSATQNPTALSRLQAMEQTNDGFKLAELDLSNRGAGDIFGIMQSGDINLKMASLSDRVMIEKASSSAKEIVADDIKKYPMLVEKVKAFEMGRHLE